MNAAHDKYYISAQQEDNEKRNETNKQILTNPFLNNTQCSGQTFSGGAVS